MNACVTHVKATAAQAQSIDRVRPSAKLAGHKYVIEICTDEDSNLGKCAEEFDGVTVLRITKKDDFSDPSKVKEIENFIRDHPGCNIHGSLPFAVWCNWQFMSTKRHGPKYVKRLQERRETSRNMLRNFIACAEIW